MTGFGPLDEATLTTESEYGGGPGLVQLGPGGRELYAGEKSGILVRAGREIERRAGAMFKVDASTGLSEINTEDAVDPVTGISVAEAQADGPVAPK